MCRMTIPKPLGTQPQPPRFSFIVLERTVRALFGLPASHDIALTYEDPDGDDVTIGSDADIAEALLHQRLNPLRLHLSVNSRSFQSHGGSAGADELAGAAPSAPTAAATTPPSACAVPSTTDAAAVAVAGASDANPSTLTHAALVPAAAPVAAAAAANPDVECLRELIAEVKRTFGLSDEEVKAAARALSLAALNAAHVTEEVVKGPAETEEEVGGEERAGAQEVIIPKFVVNLAKKFKEAWGEFVEEMRSKAPAESSGTPCDGFAYTIQEIKEGIIELMTFFGQKLPFSLERCIN